MDTDSIKEEPVYDLSGLFVELGGALSLFLGVTIVSAFKYLGCMLRFIFSLLINLCQLRCNSNNMRSKFDIQSELNCA